MTTFDHIPHPDARGDFATAMTRRMEVERLEGGITLRTYIDDILRETLRIEEDVLTGAVVDALRARGWRVIDPTRGHYSQMVEAVLAADTSILDAVNPREQAGLVVDAILAQERGEEISRRTVPDPVDVLRAQLSTWLSQALDVGYEVTGMDLLALREWVDAGCPGECPEPG